MFDIVESGFAIMTVCVLPFGKSVSVIVVGEPTVTEVAVVIGDPAGALVDRDPVSSGELPLTFIAVIAKVCQVEEARPVAL